MNLLSNSNFDTIFNKVDNVFSSTDNTEKTEIFNANDFFKLGNILNGSNNQISDPKATQNNKNIDNGIKALLSLFDKISSSSESKRAQKEIQNNNKASQKLLKEEEDARKQIYAEISKIQAGITTEITRLKNAIDNVEKTKDSLEAPKEKISEIAKKIEEKQKALKQAKTPEEQKKILTEIKDLSGEITSTIKSVEELSKEIEKSSTEVQNATINIETAKGNAVEVNNNGELTILNIAQKGKELVQKNITTKVQGSTNITTGIAAENAANAANSNLITSTSVAPKLYKVAADQKSAGQTRITGSKTNLTTVMHGIGKLKDNSEILRNFRNGIGGALDTFNDYIGSWNSTLSPVIESIGSFNSVSEANTQLNNSINNDLQKIDNQPVNKKTEKTKQNNKSKDAPTVNKNIDHPTDSQESNTLQTLNFDINSLNVFEKNKKKVK